MVKDYNVIEMLLVMIQLALLLGKAFGFRLVGAVLASYSSTAIEENIVDRI
jgi:hypothetical protein